MKLLFALAAMAAFVGIAHADPIPQNCHSSHGYYRSSDGSEVHGPQCADNPLPGATAICRDGSQSFSHHHRGTCSGHGGVARYL